jgi:hypothetical protein
MATDEQNPVVEAVERMRNLANPHLCECGACVLEREGDALTITAELTRLRAQVAERDADIEALVPLVPMMEDLAEESGKSYDFGEEDPFRRGEWFAQSELAQIAAARAALARVEARNG